MMEKKEIIKLPQIFDCGGRISEKDDWFIEFYVRNPRTDRMQRFKKYKGINKFHTLKERRIAAEKMKQYWTDKLRSGWTPFSDTSVIYDDNLEYQTSIKKYRSIKATNGTIRFYSSKYLDFIKSQVESSTIGTYRSKLRMFAAWMESKGYHEADISIVTQPVMMQFFNHIIHECKLSKTSVHQYKHILARMFKYVQKQKDRKHFINPCYDLPSTKRVNDHTPQPIHEMDIVDFKDVIKEKDPQLWLAIQFQYYCALRPGKELRLLKINEIDFGRGKIRVIPEDAKKTDRYVDIPDVFLYELRKNYKLHEYPRNYYVFGKNGKPGLKYLGKNNLRFRFVAFREKLDMPKMYKFYSWKHTGGIAADNANIPREELQNQFGHSSMLITENYLKNKNGHKTPNIKKRFPEIGTTS